MRGLAFGICMSMFGGMTFAGEPEGNLVRFWAAARVVVDEGGVPTQVEPNAKLKAYVRDMVEQRVRQWRFQPIVVDGMPKAGVTYVFLDACATRAVGGGWDVELKYRRNGPGHADGEATLSSPAYPMQALRGKSEGNFRTVVKVGVDGRAELETIESITGSPRPFKASLQSWVQSLRFVPEEVDGMPVATRIVLPVEFSMSPSEWTDRDPAGAKAGPPTCEMILEDAQESASPALDSPFKPLRTD